MTFANHAGGGAAIYGSLAAIATAALHAEPLTTGVILGAAMALGATIGAEPDTGDWIYSEITGYPKWGPIYNAWHNDRTVQRRWRWTLAIPLHLEIVDPIVHVGGTPGLLGLKLPQALKNKPVAFGLTLWDLCYTAIEAAWWAAYAGTFLGALKIAAWIR